MDERIGAGVGGRRSVCVQSVSPYMESCRCLLQVGLSQAQEREVETVSIPIRMESWTQGLRPIPFAAK